MLNSTNILQGTSKLELKTMFIKRIKEYLSKNLNAFELSIIFHIIKIIFYNMNMTLVKPE